MSQATQVPKINKVLFIDDDEYTIAYYKVLSKDFNLAKESLFFTDATVALKHLESIVNEYEFPDLILVDINMPQLDGHEFVTTVMEMPQHHQQRTAIVFLTSSKEMTDIVKADENQVEHYYWKPLTENIIR